MEEDKNDIQQPSTGSGIVCHMRSACGHRWIKVLIGAVILLAVFCLGARFGASHYGKVQYGRGFQRGEFSDGFGGGRMMRRNGVNFGYRMMPQGGAWQQQTGSPVAPTAPDASSTPALAPSAATK